MNLLILSQHFYPERFQINMIAQELLARGYQVSVLTGQPNYPEGKVYRGYKSYKCRKEIWESVTIYRVPLIPRKNAKNINLILNYLSFMVSSSLFSIFLKKKKFDGCFVFQTSPIFMALGGVVLKKFFKVPLFLWVQDLWPESLSATKRLKSPFVEKIIRKFVRMVYKNSDVIFTQSKAFFNPIKEIYPQANLSFLPNTCENFYRPVGSNHITSEYAIPEGFIVMFTGNMGSAQALSTIIAAAKILNENEQNQEIKWVFVGSGSELEKTKSKVKELMLENTVVFLGSFPAIKIPGIIAKADVCLATLNKSEIFSLTVPAKIQSYMACEKPIIAAIDGEVCRIINEANCGMSIPSEDHIALADAVLKMQQLSIEERNDMGRAARLYFELNYDGEKIIDHLCSTIEKNIDILSH